MILSLFNEKLDHTRKGIQSVSLAKITDYNPFLPFKIQGTRKLNLVSDIRHKKITVFQATH